ncbi:hypothetical protein PMAYCL1PPCAC_18199 [Pristionchus mayeri]|uniref:tRNA (cytosine(38)-C(5))-methyltransferase n=1 Tax=Pristionchus mayeri TaxID=1317129 RepID=A0AAN5CP48_9BILA|nr:hypothetical protein PMAYCL1PPCAC_18199 [Pristionchus mayeri]
MGEVSQINAIEFYCGIGGTHFALKGKGVEYTLTHALSSVFPGLSKPINVIAAFDINTTTNSIYKCNFPATKLYQNNIQGLSAASLDKFDAQLWTMSPPCQPFTLKGNLKGKEDRRCDSFKALLASLDEMKRAPRWIFIENVSNFYSTSMHSILIETLNSVGYEIEEYILSPVQFGIPNSRPRYYLMASRKEGRVEYHSHLYHSIEGVGEFEASKIEDYLSNNEEIEYLPSVKIEQNNISIVESSAITSSCFTKSYTQYLVGCGSYLRDSKGIRPFSPREVASLMSFPYSFSWPEHITHKQVYRALGNSVNVAVVSKLLERLLQV